MPLFDFNVISEILYSSLEQFQINAIQVISVEREKRKGECAHFAHQDVFLSVIIYQMSYQYRKCVKAF